MRLGRLHSARLGRPSQIDLLVPVATILANAKIQSEAEVSHQIGFPQPFTSPKELVTCRPAHDEVFRVVDTPNAIKAANKRLSCGVIDSRNHGADEVGAKSPLVEARTD